MSLSEQIVDQWVTQAVQDQKEFLEESLKIKNDLPKARSAVFVLLCAEALLGFDREESRLGIVEGGNDFGVDAIYLSEVTESDFKVTVFQGKYHQKLDGSKGFPMDGISKVIAALKAFFDPQVEITFNARLTARVAEIRSLISDGLIPNISVVLCSNGKKWEANAERIRANYDPPQVTWEDHLDAEKLIALKGAPKPVTAKLHFSGKSFVEGYEFRRVAVGKIRVSELASLFETEGDRLLERNIRRYLGQSGRINRGIEETLKNEADRSNFYFFNNGITIVCSKFTHNELQEKDHIFNVQGLEVINGGQTCKTIQQVLKSIEATAPGMDQAFVLVRLYELPVEDADLVRSITYATNSQNPVDLRDLKSNDPIQRALERSIAALNYNYVRYKSASSSSDGDISSAVAAQSVLAVWRKRPQMAKYQGGEHFGKFYDVIFSPDLNGAQVVLAVEIFRYVEKRRRTSGEDAPRFIAYGSQVLSMVVAEELLNAVEKELPAVTHVSLPVIQAHFGAHADELYDLSLGRVEQGLKKVFGVTDLGELSWPRLAGCFRRGDLVEELKGNQHGSDHHS
jgi:hypothetical protein